MERILVGQIWKFNLYPERQDFPIQKILILGVGENVVRIGFFDQDASHERYIERDRFEDRKQFSLYKDARP